MQMMFKQYIPNKAISNVQYVHRGVCVCVFVTKVWLSTKVTSAQKLEIVMAMVFPLKPSEGFPINPTLWVIVYLDQYLQHLSDCVYL